jgi:hypothetical protein
MVRARPVRRLLLAAEAQVQFTLCLATATTPGHQCDRIDTAHAGHHPAGGADIHVIADGRPGRCRRPRLADSGRGKQQCGCERSTADGGGGDERGGEEGGGGAHGDQSFLQGRGARREWHAGPVKRCLRDPFRRVVLSS